MQIVLNILLYGILGFWLYESVMAKDYWYAFVVTFVIAVAAVVTVLPGYHASKVSPGAYPYDN